MLHLVLLRAIGTVINLFSRHETMEHATSTGRHDARVLVETSLIVVQYTTSMETQIYGA